MVNDAPGPDEARDQQVGLNVELPDSGSERPDWFRDIEESALYLSELSSRYGCDFIIGIADSTSRIAEDLFLVTSKPPDLAGLRRIIGIEEE